MQVPSIVFQLISYLSLFVPTPDNTNMVLVRTSIGMFVLLTQSLLWHHIFFYCKPKASYITYSS